MRNLVFSLIVFLLFLTSAWCLRSEAQAPPVSPGELPPGADVLARGPVNEAFAEPTPLEDQAGLVAPREPPASIDEFPPSDAPAGGDYVWVPGYWSWDTDRNDFIWVGACWRLAPPRMYWVPGYWDEVSDGWEWVAGFWAPVGTQEIEYLPPPPPPEDLEASGPPPDPDHIWVPGCWYWAKEYVFRPGYWLPERVGWVWVPSHFQWAPRGFIFVAGYWDYPFDQRGILFAPVYFPPSVYNTPGFAYTPGVVIDLDAISVSLFAYPRYCHYFFGDYYDDSYTSIGIYPRFDSDRLHTWYDPTFEYDRWRNRRTDPQWEEQQRRTYDRYRKDREARPPRTYREVQARMAESRGPQQRRIELVRPLQAVVSTKTTPIQFERMSPDARQRIARSGSDVHQYGMARRQWETSSTAPAGVTRPARPRGPAAPPSQSAPAQARPPVQQPPAVSGRPAPPPGHEVRVIRPERVEVPPPPVVAGGRAQPEGPRHIVAPPPAPKGERTQRPARQTPRERQGKKQR